MIRRPLGASLGGTTRGGQKGVDCATLRSILPPNFKGGCGSCLPSIVVVALGEPGTPVICCATATSGTPVATASGPNRMIDNASRLIGPLLLARSSHGPRHRPCRRAPGGVSRRVPEKGSPGVSDH